MKLDDREREQPAEKKNRVGRQLHGCPCQLFNSVDKIRSTLIAANNDESNDRFNLLLDWINGVDSDRKKIQLKDDHDGAATAANSCHGNGSATCRQRASASLFILNTLREVCRPYFRQGNNKMEAPKQQIRDEAEKNKKQTLPSLSSSDDFPVLGGVSSSSKVNSVSQRASPNSSSQEKGNPKARSKPKRRIRPVSIAPSSVQPSVTSVWNTNNTADWPAPAAFSSTSRIKTLWPNSGSTSTEQLFPVPTSAKTPPRNGRNIRIDTKTVFQRVHREERHNFSQKRSFADKVDQSKERTSEVSSQIRMDDVPRQTKSQLMSVSRDHTPLRNSTDDSSIVSHETACSAITSGFVNDSHGKVHGSALPMKSSDVTTLTPSHKKKGSLQTDVSNSGSCNETSLQRLVQLYCSLIESFLVPSSALEIHLLIRLLTLSPEHCENIKNDESRAMANQELGFFSILSTSSRCLAFAKASLRRLVPLLHELGTLLYESLIRCPAFVRHLPDLAAEFRDCISEHQQKVAQQVSHRTATVRVSPDPTSAHWTLPFRPDRDSRHLYQSTRADQLIYQNREACRDLFVSMWRTFLKGRGTLDASAAHTTLAALTPASRQIIANVKDANYEWFAEFVCDLLLQVGNVPLQETDSELLRITNEEKLQKLHSRFTKSANRTDTSSKAISKSTETDAGSPVTSAQQGFVGHQEFFYLFIVSMDSYKFTTHLKAIMISKMRNLCRLDEPSTKDGKGARVGSAGGVVEPNSLRMNLCLLSKFVGVLSFSPNWQNSSTYSRKLSTVAGTTLDGFVQLCASGLDIHKLLCDSIQTDHLEVTVSWIVELLKMTKWDVRVSHSSQYWEVLALLRHIQLECGKTSASQGCALSLSRTIIVQRLENLFGEVVGLMQTMKLRKLDQSVQVTITESVVSSSSTASTLYAANLHLEELSSLIVDLTRKDSFSLRSPGASRKLVRPSIVSPLSIRSLQSPSKSPSIVGLTRDLSYNCSPSLAGPSNGTRNGIYPGATNSFQLKLQESYFHQHGELRSLCEFACSQILRNIGATLVKLHIEPILFSGHHVAEELFELEKSACSACMIVLNKTLDENLKGSIDYLAPENTEEAVKEIAVSLAIEQGRVVGENMVVSLVKNEIAKLKVMVEKNDRKRLFFQDTGVTDSARQNGETYRRDYVAITSKMQQLALYVKSPTNYVEDSFSTIKSLNAELQNWSKQVDTTIPPENVLRPFFESILELDDSSIKFIEWITGGSKNSEENRAALLFEFIHLGVSLAKFSRHGFRTLFCKLKADEDIFKYLLRYSIDDSETSEPLLRLVANLVGAKVLSLSDVPATLYPAG